MVGGRRPSSSSVADSRLSQAQALMVRPGVNEELECRIGCR